MKAILITVLLVVAMVFMGWLTFSSGDGQASVTVDTEEVKKDTAAAVEKGKQLVEGGADAIQDEDVDAEQPTVEEPVAPQ